MSKFHSKDDQNLVAFLQQYRPIPPPASASTEAELMELIDTEESRNSLKIKPIIAIASSAIICGIFSLVGYRSFNPSYTNAQLESFMVNSWDGTVEQTSDRDLLLLGDREIDSDFSNQ